MAKRGRVARREGAEAGAEARRASVQGTGALLIYHGNVLLGLSHAACCFYKPHRAWERRGCTRGRDTLSAVAALGPGRAWRAPVRPVWHPRRRGGACSKPSPRASPCILGGGLQFPETAPSGQGRSGNCRESVPLYG